MANNSDRQSMLVFDVSSTLALIKQILVEPDPSYASNLRAMHLFSRNSQTYYNTGYLFGNDESANVDESDLLLDENDSISGDENDSH